MKIQINNKEVELKNTIRSLIIYENITNQTFFAPSTLEDVITYFYCVVVASSKDYSLKFDDFVDWIDENPNVLNEFTKWFQDLAQTTEDIKKKSTLKVAKVKK